MDWEERSNWMASSITWYNTARHLFMRLFEKQSLRNRTPGSRRLCRIINEISLISNEICRNAIANVYFRLAKYQEVQGKQFEYLL